MELREGEKQLLVKEFNKKEIEEIAESTSPFQIIDVTSLGNLESGDSLTITNKEISDILKTYGIQFSDFFRWDYKLIKKPILLQCIVDGYYSCILINVVSDDLTSLDGSLFISGATYIVHIEYEQVSELNFVIRLTKYQ